MAIEREVVINKKNEKIVSIPVTCNATLSKPEYHYFL